jgi:hypothetical protein
MVVVTTMHMLMPMMPLRLPLKLKPFDQKSQLLPLHLLQSKLLPLHQHLLQSQLLLLLLQLLLPLLLFPSSGLLLLLLLQLPLTAQLQSLPMDLPKLFTRILPQHMSLDMESKEIPTLEVPHLVTMRTAMDTPPMENIVLSFLMVAPRLSPTMFLMPILDMLLMSSTRDSPLPMFLPQGLPTTKLLKPNIVDNIYEKYLFETNKIISESNLCHCLLT